jgi:L-2-hydroxyglutarate oxidase LhgO
MSVDVDAVVVGAGAVGLATAHALGRAGRASRGGREVVVIEAEAGIGQGVSARNSEVIHAGLYYPTGSLKARLCVEGRRRLYGFLADHGVGHDKCAKLVVATEDAELERLEEILAQARINGVEGVELLSGAQARALEPALKAAGALFSPESGVMDSHGFMLALRGEVEDAGGAIALNTRFEGAAPIAGGGFRIRTSGAESAEIAARELVIAAGLGAQAAARAIEGYPSTDIPRLFYGKGVYFALAGRPPFSRLIYPPPVAGAHGVHYRRDLGGQARFGPDLAWVETLDYAVDAARAASFYATVRRFWPGLPEGALVPDYAGIRPKLHGPGEPQPDFRIDDVSVHGLAGLVTLFGIESPGLTSSLAIGDEVAKRLGR